MELQYVEEQDYKFTNIGDLGLLDNFEYTSSLDL